MEYHFITKSELVFTYPFLYTVRFKNRMHVFCGYIELKKEWKIPGEKYPFKLLVTYVWNVVDIETPWILSTIFMNYMARCLGFLMQIPICNSFSPVMKQLRPPRNAHYFNFYLKCMSTCTYPFIAYKCTSAQNSSYSAEIHSELVSSTARWYS